MVARRGRERPPLLSESPPTSAFWSAVEPWAAKLRALGGSPAVEDIDRTLSRDAGIRFEPAAPRGRGARRTTAPSYDERIVEHGVVPTREGNLHDLMNALVWAAFPRAKRALHERQLALVRSAADRGRRSVEHDTIAMLDEGGVLLTNAEVSDDAAARPGASIVFGHALYQHLVERSGPVYGLGVPIPVDDSPLELASADRALAGMLAESGRFTTHRCFSRVRVE